MIGMPIADGYTPWPTTVSLMGTIRVLDREKIPFLIDAPVGCSVVTWARGAVAGAFLRSKCTHLFWIDSDISWRPKDFIRMLGFAAVYDIICGVYAFKKDPPGCLINLPGTDGEREVDGHGNVHVKSLGLGFTIVKRAVMEKLAEGKPIVRDPLNKVEYPDIFRLDRRENGCPVGEDVCFFEDAAALGFQAWLDPTIKLGHTGSKTFTIDPIEALGLEEFAQEKQQ